MFRAIKIIIYITTLYICYPLELYRFVGLCLLLVLASFIENLHAKYDYQEKEKILKFDKWKNNWETKIERESWKRKK